MCCCPKPNKNGEPGYCWNPPAVSTLRYSINAPDLLPDETLLFDEPGRCRPQINGQGSTDYHHQHFRLVGSRFGSFRLLARHGGGDERLDLGEAYRRIADLAALLPDSDARFLFFEALYSTASEAAQSARASEAYRWRSAIADGRARKRRLPRQGTTKVWIEDGPRCYDTEEGKPEKVRK